MKKLKTTLLIAAIFAMTISAFSQDNSSKENTGEENEPVISDTLKADS